MTVRGLSTADNLFDFFHEQVDHAVDSTGTEVSEEGVYYLAQLLADRGHSPTNGHPDTLVELQIEASSGERTGAISAWRELGDRALYTLGFFRRSIRRKSIDANYYHQMGASAYGRLASMLRTPNRLRFGEARGMDDIFAELSDCFGTYAKLLQEVRSTSKARLEPKTDSAVLALYEEWLETGSAVAEARLRTMGVLPINPQQTSGTC